MKFKDQRTNEVKEVITLERKDGKVYVQFEENGKIYGYNESNIEVLESSENITGDRLIVYSYMQECYKCKRETEILTYIVYRGTKHENLCYPWDKNRLNKNQSWEEIMAHMQHLEIEFYPIKVMGSDQCLDEIMMKNYPNRIIKKYSNTQKRNYPMNVCQHCGAKQGEFYVYSEINKRIQQMEEINIVGEISLD